MTIEELRAEELRLRKIWEDAAEDGIESARLAHHRIVKELLAKLETQYAEPPINPEEPKNHSITWLISAGDRPGHHATIGVRCECGWRHLESRQQNARRRTAKLKGAKIRHWKEVNK